MNINKPVKLFIVDDHYMVIEGIHSLLQHETNIEWMGHATNADSCLAFLNSSQPDIVFMDISLPGISGIDLCKMVKEKFPAISIIGLSTFNQQSFIQRMLDHGASGYVLKNATREELMEAVASVEKGRQYLSHEVSQMLRSQETSGIVLTRREKEVLVLIADGLTNMEIAKALFVSSTTVDTHRKNLLAKFNVKNTASLIRKAVQHQLL